MLIDSCVWFHYYNVLVPTHAITKHFKKPGFTQIQSMTKIVANQGLNVGTDSFLCYGFWFKIY